MLKILSFRNVEPKFDGFAPILSLFFTLYFAPIQSWQSIGSYSVLIYWCLLSFLLGLILDQGNIKRIYIIIAIFILACLGSFLVYYFNFLKTDDINLSYIYIFIIFCCFLFFHLKHYGDVRSYDLAILSLFSFGLGMLSRFSGDVFFSTFCFHISSALIGYFFLVHVFSLPIARSVLFSFSSCNLTLFIILIGPDSKIPIPALVFLSMIIFSGGTISRVNFSSSLFLRIIGAILILLLASIPIPLATLVSIIFDGN